MVELTTPGFLVGEMAWLSDGRAGRIAGGNFNADAGEWLWAIDGIGGPFRESDLFHFDPTAEVPVVLPGLPEVGESVSSDDLREAIESVVVLIESLPLGLQREAVRQMVNSGVESAVEAAQAFTVEETNKVRDATAINLAGLSAGLTGQLEELESAVVPVLSQLAERLSSLETVAEEASGMSIGDFFQGLGNFLASPLGYVLDKSEDYILTEVEDGLSR